MSSFLYLLSFLVPIRIATSFFLLSHCLNVQGLIFNILETCSIVNREDQVFGSDGENDVIDLLLPITYTKLTELNVRCKMQNEITKDALKLASNILKSLLPDEKLPVVNIAIDDRDTFTLEGYTSIPQSFGYRYDKTSILLKLHGVFEGETIGWWYVGTIKMSSYLRKVLPDELSMDDNISEIARKKGYIDKDEAVQYYYNVSKEDTGPKMHGQAAILINRQKIEDFISWCNSLKPIFNDETNYLEFLGEKVLFEGALEKKCVKLLIKHINSTVSYKEFYEVRDKDYKAEVAEFGKTISDDPSRVMFKRIRVKIKRNKKLKEVLILKESGGFGMSVKKDNSYKISSDN